MLLSIQQKYILAVLRELGCLRNRQLQALIQSRFDWTGPDAAQRRMEAMLHQLRSGMAEFHSGAEFVWLGNTQPIPRLLEAVDVMLELAEGRPRDFSVKCQCPELLRFSLEGSSLRLFTVATLSDPLRGISGLARDSPGRVVWISDSGTPPDKLALPPKHFFAARQPDGSHRFYGS